MPGLTGVVQIAAGYQHVLALKSDGTVWAWGYNFFRELGDGTQTDRATPFQIPGLTGIAQVSASYYDSMALGSDGSVWAWGHNGFGELGDGTTTNRPTPVKLPGLSGVTQISAGYEHGLAVKSDGTVWAWGNNAFGQLGVGTNDQPRLPGPGAWADRRHAGRGRPDPQPGDRRARRFGLGLGRRHQLGPRRRGNHGAEEPGQHRTEWHYPDFRWSAPERGLRRHARALARKRLEPRQLPVAGHGALGERLPRLGPVAELIAVPRRRAP